MNKKNNNNNNNNNNKGKEYVCVELKNKNEMWKSKN